jgi:cation/acetate symporter
VLGWTGGFCLVALLIAPHLRAMGLYTVPDFFHVRFGGRWPRIIAALAAVLCSFTYVVAQIYGVGLIASRLTGVQFEIGIMLGLGGVLLCSFLGGMRAITWTQVAQYVVVLLAFLIPVSWLAYKQLGNPMAPLVYGAQPWARLPIWKAAADSPAEHQVVVRLFAPRPGLRGAAAGRGGRAGARARKGAQERVRALRDQNADVGLIVAASRELVSNLPRDAAIGARALWREQMRETTSAPAPWEACRCTASPSPATPTARRMSKEYELARRNFLALMFCLMVGTAGLPHLLTRYYTAPSVAGARTLGGVVAVFYCLALP